MKKYLFNGYLTSRNGNLFETDLVLPSKFAIFHNSNYNFKTKLITSDGVYQDLYDNVFILKKAFIHSEVNYAAKFNPTKNERCFVNSICGFEVKAIMKSNN